MIKTTGEMTSLLKGYDSKGWTKSANLNLNTEFAQAPNVPGTDGDKTKSFGEFLMDSISKVNDLQNDADVAMQKLASGETKNLHETMIMVEKADIAFKAMNQIRMKVIDAYKDIMRMQI